jgi:hypothetical protein
LTALIVLLWSHGPWTRSGTQRKWMALLSSEVGMCIRTGEIVWFKVLIVQVWMIQLYSKRT